MNVVACIAALLFSLSLLTPAFAKEPLPPVEAETSQFDDLSTSLTLGYDSRYILYGYRLGHHLFHGDVYFYLPVSEKLSAWAGSWYGATTDGNYNEVDLYAGLDVALCDYASVGVGYSIFHYLEVPFETSGEAHEGMLRLSVYQGPMTLSLRAHYDSEANGILYRGTAEYTRPLAEKLALYASAEYGYAADYFIDGDEPNHAYFVLRLPIQITPSLSAAPFVAHSIPLEAIDDFEEEQSIGGLWITASF